MTSISNVIGRLDKKLTAYALDQYQDRNSANTHGLKPHSIITTITGAGLLVALGTFFQITFDNAYGHGFMILFKSVLVIFFIAISIATFYQWRVLFSLRRAGLNADKNLFFNESTGIYRKAAFYIALTFNIITTIHSRLYPEDLGQHLRRLKFQLRSEYYHDASILIIDSILFSILWIEVMRISFAGPSTWSNKKAAAVLILSSFSFSGIRVFFLSLASGHGIF
jgi:hypothetical protein